MRGNYYWADISIPNPNGGDPIRIRKTTKKTTKKAAQDAAATMAEAEEKKAGADDETTDAVLAVLPEGARLHAQGRLTLEKGRALVAEMVAASAGGKLEFFTVRRWFPEWLEGRRNVVKEGTFAQ